MYCGHHGLPNSDCSTRPFQTTLPVGRNDINISPIYFPKNYCLSHQAQTKAILRTVLGTLLEYLQYSATIDPTDTRRMVISSLFSCR